MKLTRLTRATNSHGLFRDAAIQFTVKSEAVRDFDEFQAAVITQEFHRFNTTVVCEKTEGNIVAGEQDLNFFS